MNSYVIFTIAIALQKITIFSHSLINNVFKLCINIYSDVTRLFVIYNCLEEFDEFRFATFKAQSKFDVG